MSFAFADIKLIEGNAGLSIGLSDSPDPSALLDLTSTTKGLLLPRLTTIQRDEITNPATGLQIYNTDNNTNEYYIGTKWTSNIFLINVKDHGAVGDGSTDDTAAFESAFEALSSTRRVIYVPTGNYIIDNLNITVGNFTMKGDGLSSVLTYKISNRRNDNLVDTCILKIYGTSETNINNIIIENLKIYGNKDDPDFTGPSAKCIKLKYVANVSILNVYISDIEHTGLYFEICSDILISDVYITNTISANTSGIYIDTSTSILIKNTNVNYCGFGIELFENNKCKLYNCTSNYSFVGISCQGITNIDLFNCSTVDSTFAGLACIITSVCTITNYIGNNNGNGNGDGFDLYLAETTHTIINSCQIYSSYSGIYLYTSSDVSIINCQLNNNTTYGIYLQNSNNNEIINNRLITNDYGIYIGANVNTNNTISNNLIKDSVNENIHTDNLCIGNKILFNISINPGIADVIIDGNLIAILDNTGLTTETVVCNSVSNGFTPPRLTTTQQNNIPTPTEGLIIFNTTTGKLCVYASATWNTLAYV